MTTLNRDVMMRPVYGPYHLSLIRAHRERRARLFKPEEKPEPKLAPPPESVHETPAEERPKKTYVSLSRVAAIQTLVADEYGVTRDDLIGPRRIKGLIEPRHVATLLCHELLDGVSLPWIGRRFGGGTTRRSSTALTK